MPKRGSRKQQQKATGFFFLEAGHGRQPAGDQLDDTAGGRGEKILEARHGKDTIARQ